MKSSTAVFGVRRLSAKRDTLIYRCHAFMGRADLWRTPSGALILVDNESGNHVQITPEAAELWLIACAIPYDRIHAAIYGG